METGRSAPPATNWRSRPGDRRAVKFSFASLARQALSGHQGWPEQWRSPEPKPAYDAVIVGAGGHGLAAAYYMAKEHGLQEHRRPRQGLARRRQYRAQHHDRPLQLPLGGFGSDLRPRPQAVDDAVPGAQLQRDVLAARRHAARAQPSRGAGVQASNSRQPPGGDRRRMVDCRAGEGILPDPQHRSRNPLSRRRRRVAAHRRHGAPRRGRLGLSRAPPRRSGSTSSRTARSTAIRRDAIGRGQRPRDDARRHRDEEDRRRRRRKHERRHGDGGGAAAARVLPACRRWCPSR